MADIYSLLHHLKNCPEVFLQVRADHPEAAPEADVLVKDCYRKMGGNFNISDSNLPDLTKIDQLAVNHQASIQVGCWFFSYPYFFRRRLLVQLAHLFLTEDLARVSEYVKAREWVDDEDRAEEFIRLALKRMEIIPEGETALQAADRLDALDTIKRQAVLRESNEAMERVREIRRQMAEKKAREAASVYGRE